MDMDIKDLISVKVEPGLSEEESTNVVSGVSCDMNSVQSADSSCSKGPQILPMVRMNVASARQQRSAPHSTGEAQGRYRGTALHIKVERADTDDIESVADRDALGLSSTWDVPLDVVKLEPRGEDDTESVTDRDALGLSSTWDVPLDVVKLEPRGEDGPPVDETSLLVPLKHEEDTATEYITRSYENNVETEQPQKSTCTIHDANLNKIKIEAYNKVDTMLYEQSRSNENQLNEKCILKSHIRPYTDGRSHTDEKSFMCDLCKKCFSNKRNLSLHIRTHTATPHKCKICLKSYTHKSDLQKHLRKHTGEKPHECNVCKKRFYTKCILVHHMRTHTGEKPFHCNICNKYFSQKSNLSVHIRTHTRDTFHQCNICLKSFLRKSEVDRHMRTHTGEKPYECNVCNKSFGNRDHLVVHLRLHTGERPHKCNICLKYFTSKSNLSTHLRTHTGEKPFECSVCKKCFGTKSNLRAHFRTHTGEKPKKKR